MARLAVFAYGSLASPASAAYTLDRPVEAVRPAELAGWRRRWSTCRDNTAVEKTFARKDGTLPRHVLGLNLEPAAERADGEAAGGAPNGALVEVSEAELRRLDVRELRYDRIEVTGSVAAAPGLDGPDPEEIDAVFSYVAKQGHFAREPPPGCVILASYVRAVESAFRQLGENQLDRFHETTGPFPVEVVEATLIRDDIPEGNPRGW